MAGTQLTYQQIRAANDAEYTRQHKDMWHSYWPLENQGNFQQYHGYAMAAICVLANPATPPASGPLDWTQAATAAVVVPTVDAAVEQDITHGVVPLSPITGLGVKFINELLLNKIQTELATANYGTTASEHYAQIQEWTAQSR
jgi:hypothetical protein